MKNFNAIGISEPNRSNINALRAWCWRYSGGNRPNG
jgi:hypothetical protein